MNIVLNLILAAQLLSAVAMIGLVLIQHGKGADMGAAFGSGTSGSLFGASGSANFLSRTTAVLATVFFAATLALAYFGTPHTAGTGSVMDSAVAPVPAGTASGAAQIPTAGASAAAPAAATAPVIGASGASQIPTK